MSRAAQKAINIGPVAEQQHRVGEPQSGNLRLQRLVQIPVSADHCFGTRITPQDA